jgi:signal transduction histidine kinase
MDLADHSAVVMGEVRLVERVLDNLVDNAIRFTPPGGSVGVSCALAGDRVVVRVIDTGPGISEGDRERIFDRFYRGRQPAESSSDTAGLGLSIARRIVARHGGELNATHGRRVGAEFVLWLPAVR